MSLFPLEVCFLCGCFSVLTLASTHGVGRTYTYFRKKENGVAPSLHAITHGINVFTQQLNLHTFLLQGFNQIPNGFICLFISPLGINAQARKLQKSRSRVTSTLMARTAGRGHKLWRSKSEMDLLDSDAQAEQDGERRDACRKDRSESLNQTSAQSSESPETSLEQDRIHSPAVPSEGDDGPKTEGLCPARPRAEREGEESEREETESSDDNTTQYSIHPPPDCPYLLLLQGCSPAQVSHSDTRLCWWRVEGVILVVSLVLAVKIPVLSSSMASDWHETPKTSANFSDVNVNGWQAFEILRPFYRHH